VFAFGATNFWSYSQGRQTGDALLIETLERYRAFYEEVRAAPDKACDPATDQLTGLYRMQYDSMLPVIADQIVAPYDNPCPVSAPKPPENLVATVCSGWTSWEDFLSDSTPTISMDFGGVVGVFAMSPESKASILAWRETPAARNAFDAAAAAAQAAKTSAAELPPPTGSTDVTPASPTLR
jgi:hypothetical protein